MKVCSYPPVSCIVQNLCFLVGQAKPSIRLALQRSEARKILRRQIVILSNLPRYPGVRKFSGLIMQMCATLLRMAARALQQHASMPMSLFWRNVRGQHTGRRGVRNLGVTCTRVYRWMVERNREKSKVGRCGKTEGRKVGGLRGNRGLTATLTGCVDFSRS